MFRAPLMDYHDEAFLEDVLEHYAKGNADWEDGNCSDTIEALRDFLEEYLDELYQARINAFAENYEAELSARRKGGNADGFEGPADDDLLRTAGQIDAIELALFGRVYRDDSELLPDYL